MTRPIKTSYCDGTASTLIPRRYHPGKLAVRRTLRYVCTSAVPPVNGILSTVFRLVPPSEEPLAEALRAEGGLWLELEEGPRLRLDPDYPGSVALAQILERQQQRRLPVYVEFDPATSAVTRLRLPYVSLVLGIRFIDRGVFDVMLANSHARHYLRQASEDFETLRARLDEAIQRHAHVILADDDAHDIIDVQLAPPGFEEPGRQFP